jgi:O-antigen ligase
MLRRKQLVRGRRQQANCDIAVRNMSETTDGTAKIFDRQRWARAADALALAVVVALPWSTSATGVLIAFWLIALLPTLEPAALRRELAHPAGGLPVLLWLLAAIGMLWTDASWSERLQGLDSYHKLLAIPLLFAQFRGSDKTRYIVIGLVASCTVLLATSWILVAADIQLPNKNTGVPVKDYISQSGFFAISAFVVAYMAADGWQERRFVRAILLSSLSLLFLINIGYVVSSRTVFAVIPVLLVLFALRRFRWKGVLGVFAATSVLAVIVWASSPYLRDRAASALNEARNYRTDESITSAGLRLEFYRKSIDFIAAAPLLGHGTGSINPLFRGATAGQTGIAGAFAANPHQQTLTVAIQLGILGAALLWAMWISHLLLFRTGGLVPWFGLAIVVQNIIGSLFNSHLFDFTQGWTYVFGVGVAGGMMLKSTIALPRAEGAPLDRPSQLPL